ncbi:MAG: hypothetical protein LBE36_04100 [Flavobacteriaceae bacterium]|jgi:hypothetical protein|nr:hypothetical protein [Flavobacteriaceae bacterium]
MTQITIQPKDKEEEILVENFLKTKEIYFEKDEDDFDFELTDEMKRVIDERLLEDESTYVDAFESLKKISEKYGI